MINLNSVGESNTTLPPQETHVSDRCGIQICSCRQCVEDKETQIQLHAYILMTESLGNLILFPFVDTDKITLFQR